MNIWLLAVGLVGIAAAGVWYAVLLRDSSRGRRVAFFNRGGIPPRSLYLWVLVVLLGESFVVNAVTDRGGFNVAGGVVVAFVVSELARRWHNRTVPAAVPADDESLPAD